MTDSDIVGRHGANRDVFSRRKFGSGNKMDNDLIARAAQLTHPKSSLMRALAREGLNVTERTVIALVLHGHVCGRAMSVKEIGHDLGVSKPTAIGLISGMVEKGLIEKAASTADRRLTFLQPSEGLLARANLKDSESL